MSAELAASVSRVFVTQVPHRRDQATGSYTPVFNLYPAEEFGAIVVMMPPQSAYVATSELLDQLGAKLDAYDYDRGDTVLLLGDTSLIAATVAILARRHERFAVLRWDRILQRYSRVVFSLEGFV